MLLNLVLIGLSALPAAVLAGRECVWVLGQVNCTTDKTKNLNVEIRVWDRDGVGPLQMIDPDDLMGVTFTNDNGMFQLDGCGDDFDWIPGIKNVPEPYIEIRHYCNDPKGETLTLPEFSTFVPNTYDMGVVLLDRETKGKRSGRSD